MTMQYFRKYINFFSFSNQKLHIWCIVLVFLICPKAFAQQLSASYLNYINQYKDIAIKHQQAYGIPASITLAQGLLESQAGASRLAASGNNHFGIKCHKEWTGDTLRHDDDQTQECFRKYDNAELSFEDHARFLKRKRYAPLFLLQTTDYANWAKTLRQCGYATDPAYPQKLIALIEKYELYSYDSGQAIVSKHKELKGDETIEHDIDISILDEVSMMHNIRQKKGLHYVVTHTGDSYAGIASEFGIKLKKLLSFNDVDKATVIPAGSTVYLQEKHNSLDKTAHYTVKQGDTLHSISQSLGIKLNSLCKLNSIDKDTNLTEGSTLKLH